MVVEKIENLRSRIAEEDQRLDRALGLVDTGEISPEDLTVLLRNYLVKNRYMGVRVPTTGNWPSLESWKKSSFDVEDNGALFTLKPKPWSPSWLDGNDLFPDTLIYNSEIPAKKKIESDPLWAKVTNGYNTYKTAGQRDSVRAVFSAKEGSTVIAVLPTGSGKTSVFTGPAFNKRPKLSVLVVPTVALAVDIEERLREEYDSPNEKFAFHSGLSEVDKESIKERIRNRDQWFLVLNPESAIFSLQETLLNCASEGGLAFFGIDEAHMIVTWGGEFRPTFRYLSGLISKLKEVSKYAQSEVVTVFLTGTLNQFALDTIKKLFSKETEVNIVIDQRIREEPIYFQKNVQDDIEKKEYFLDSLFHLPRPILVYVSLVNSERAVNAEQALRWIRDSGFNRAKKVVGGELFENLKACIANIKCENSPEDDIDIIVASSAFGLGVDIPNIRTVIHLCIPETIHRFYQEVGRGGRDGKSSLSLLLHNSDSDRDVAQKLALGDPKERAGPAIAWERWKAMKHDAKYELATRLHTISLESAHSMIKHARGSYNRQFNMQVLSTMAQVGMITLKGREKIEFSEAQLEESNEISSEEWLRLANKTVIEIVQGDLDEDTFMNRYQCEIEQSDRVKTSELETMLEVFSGRCPNAIFANAYYIENYNGEVAFATHNCGGCSQCDYQSSYRSGSPYLHIPDIKDIKYESNLGENNDWAITYHGSDRSVDIRELVGRLTPLGLQMIVKPRDLELSHEFDEWVAVEEFSNWIKESKRSYFHTLVIFPKNPTPEQITDFLRVKGRQENSLVAVFPSDTRSNNPVYPLSREFSKNQIIDHVLKEI